MIDTIQIFGINHPLYIVVLTWYMAAFVPCIVFGTIHTLWRYIQDGKAVKFDGKDVLGF
jgi:hypothetical protein